MPARLLWTASDDDTITTMRAEGAYWDQIAVVLGISRYAVIERGRRIGARRIPAQFNPAVIAARAAADAAAWLADPRRDPLPAGHPVAWKTLTAGTWAEGTGFDGQPEISEELAPEMLAAA